MKIGFDVSGISMTPCQSAILPSVKRFAIGICLSKQLYTWNFYQVSGEMDFMDLLLREGCVGPIYGVGRPMGLNPKVRTNFGVQPHGSVR